MKFKKYLDSKKSSGFTIVESLAYIFLTTIILVEGMNLYVSMYKSYIEARALTIKYNDCQNFYINLDTIISEGNLEEIIVDNNSLLFSKDDKSNGLNKIIKSSEGKIVVKYMRSEVTETIKTMLKDIDRFEVKRKGKLIYLMIYDKEGKEFIRCI